MMIHRTASVAQPGIKADGLGDEFLGALDGGLERRAVRKLGGDGGGVNATGPMGVLRVDAGCAELTPGSAVPEDVHSIAASMASFDEHGSGAEAGELARGAAHMPHRADFHACERGCFRDI